MGIPRGYRRSPPVDFDRVNRAALGSLDRLVRTWLPDGRLEGREWTARNPKRSDRRRGSFKVNVDTGRWGDFAIGVAGGDPVSLYAYLNDTSQAAAARGLAAELGVSAYG